MSGRKFAVRRSINEQVLTEDYWTGFYAVDGHTVVSCRDVCGNIAQFTVYSLRDGRVVADGSVPYVEGATFTVIDSAVRSSVGHGMSMRISDEVDNPDRDSEIEEILEGGDIFQLARVMNLITHLQSRSIRLFGGAVGGTDLYGGSYGGFYLMGDGMVLFCHDLSDWDRTAVSMISDGVVGYRVIDPGEFSLSKYEEKQFGYLRGDRFSVLMEHLSPEHGLPFTALGVEGDEMYTSLWKALNGDVREADLASHHLRIRFNCA